MQLGGMVLCGGHSRRMGLPKATLPFGPELMIQRVLRLLGKVADPIAVVAAPDQPLPELPESVLVCRDEREGRGPLEGLRAGLKTIGSRVDAVYATSCDVPLLVPAFVSMMLESLADAEIAVPVEHTFHHPLAAVYRTSVLPTIEQLLAADRMRPVFLFDEVETVRVSVEELERVDPELHTLANLNYPQDYFDALDAAGLEAPQDIREALSKTSE